MADTKLTPDTPEEKAEKERLNTQHLHSLKIQSIKRQEKALYGPQPTLEYKIAVIKNNIDNIIIQKIFL